MRSRYRVGYMSQSFSLYSELTVRQNLDLHARLFHLSRDRSARRIDELVSQFGLGPYLDQEALALPLGIRQRLSLAVAIVHEPELLILDEPTSGVDPLARDQFWELLIDLSRNQGVTIFVSTHFMNEAARCDRISLMDAGSSAGDGLASRSHQRTGRRNSGGSFHQLPRRGAGQRVCFAARSIRFGTPQRQAEDRRRPSRPSAPVACLPTRFVRPWSCCATRSGSSFALSGLGPVDADLRIRDLDGRG